MLINKCSAEDPKKCQFFNMPSVCLYARKDKICLMKLANKTAQASYKRSPLQANFSGISRGKLSVFPASKVK